MEITGKFSHLYWRFEISSLYLEAGDVLGTLISAQFGVKLLPMHSLLK